LLLLLLLSLLATIKCVSNRMAERKAGEGWREWVCEIEHHNLQNSASRYKHSPAYMAEVLWKEGRTKAGNEDRLLLWALNNDVQTENITQIRTVGWLWIMNWKEAFVAYFNVLIQYLVGVTEEKPQNPQQVRPIQTENWTWDLPDIKEKY
jgi:hypothetical protein